MMRSWQIWFHPKRTARELDSLLQEKKVLEEEIVRLRLDMEQECRYSETLTLQRDARDKDLAAVRREAVEAEKRAAEAEAAIEKCLKELEGLDEAKAENERLKRELESLGKENETLRRRCENRAARMEIRTADNADGIVAAKDLHRRGEPADESDMLDAGESPFLSDDSDWLKHLP